MLCSVRLQSATLFPLNTYFQYRPKKRANRKVRTNLFCILVKEPNIIEQMEYQATALSDQFQNNRKSGRLIVSNYDIHFDYDGGRISWSTNDVKFSMGGTANSFVFLKNHKYPELTIYTSDKKILKDPELQRSLMVDSTHLNSLRQTRFLQNAVIVFLVLLVIAPIAYFFAFRSKIVKSIADKIPPQIEQKIGSQLHSAMVLGKDIVTDSTINAQLEQVVEPLLSTTQTDGFTFNFQIVDDTTVNAFAMPGGYVVINSGLINKADQWNEVLAVLAHEIAHVRQRHHLRGIINNYGVSFLASALFGDMSTLLNVATTVGGNLESLMYSRKFEFEADNTGWDYLQKSDIDPRGMIAFFEKLQAMSKYETIENSLSILSTHPATADRIANLKKREAKSVNGNYIQTAVDLDQFKKQMNKAVKKE